MSLSGQPLHASPLAVNALYVRHEAYAMAHTVKVSTMIVCAVSDMLCMFEGKLYTVRLSVSVWSMQGGSSSL